MGTKLSQHGEGKSTELQLILEDLGLNLFELDGGALTPLSSQASLGPFAVLADPRACGIYIVQWVSFPVVYVRPISAGDREEKVRRCLGRRPSLCYYS